MRRRSPHVDRRTPAEIEAELRVALARVTPWGVVSGVAGLLIAGGLTVLDGAGPLLIGAAGTVGTGVGVLLGASLAAVPVARRIRELLGGWSTSGERIRRVLAGGPDTLTPDEADRARRWAGLAPRWFRIDLARHVTLGAGLTLGAATLLVERLSLPVVVLLALCLTVTLLPVPARWRAIRSARGWPAALSRSEQRAREQLEDSRARLARRPFPEP